MRFAGGTVTFETESEDVEFPFPIVGEKTIEALNDLHARAESDFTVWKEMFLEWLYFEGKDPERLRGYSMATIHQTHYNIEQAFRWLWNKEGTYTTMISPENADELMKGLGRTNRSDTNLGNITTALKQYFKYQRHHGYEGIEWECKLKINDAKVTNRDYFRQHEFRPLWEAALEYQTVKGYNSVTPEERDRLKGLIAQRIGKPKSDVSPEDFKKANSFKIPTIISVTLDMGLRPIEVGRMKADWVNLDERCIMIPREGSSKNDNNWECALSSKSVRGLRNWLDERDALEKYDGRDELWLNRYGNPYDSRALNDILRKLMDLTDIEPAGRDLTWYSLRHGVCSVWADVADIHQAREQLRHKDVETTLGYAHSSPSSRLSVIDSIR